MHTRLSRFCDAIIEAGWLAALVVTPLFFNTYSNRVFEPDKLHLLRSIALVMVAAWITQLLDEGIRTKGSSGLWARIRRTPLVLPTLILVAAYLISTVLSVVPRISFFGSYVRMQGTFTFLSYVAIFFMVLTHLRQRSQVSRLIYAVILTSLPISLYGIIQKAGFDPLPWGGDVEQRVAANMGNAIFVAAYLIMAVFLTLERLVDSVAAILSEESGDLADALRAGGYFFVLAVQLIAIVFTQSRGPWLGLGAGLYVFGMFGIRMLGRWAESRPRAPRWLSQVVRPVWFFLIGLIAVVLAFLIVFNLPQSPLARLRKVPYLGRMGTVLNMSEGTNAVRVLIWEGVVDMMFKPHPPIQYPDGTPDALNPIRPLIGYGPESMWVAYNRFYPPDLAHYEARNASPDRSHNETFDALVRTGILGFGAQIFLYSSVFYYALRWLGMMQGRQRRNLFLGLLAGGAVLGVIVPMLADGSLRLAGIGLPVGLIAGVIIYVTVDLLLKPADIPKSDQAGQSEEERESQRGSEAIGQGQASPLQGITGARRQLLILALFSAIVAHFVEVHFGIAIASTLTHFWTLAAVLVVIGLGWFDQAAEGRVAATVAPSIGTRGASKGRKGGKQVTARRHSHFGPLRDSARDQRVLRQAEPSPRRGPSTAPSTGSGQALLGHTSSGRSARDGQPQGIAPTRSPVFAFLPYALIGALVTLVLTWNYLINQTGAQGAFAILWDAFTTRADAAGQIVRSPTILMLLLFTWLVGGLLAVAEVWRVRPAGQKPAQWIAMALLYVSAVVFTFLIYGLIEASRISLKGLFGLDVFHHISYHIVVFDIALLVTMVGLAVTVRFGEAHFAGISDWFGDLPSLTLAGGAVAIGLALLIIATVNIRTVRADTYYKQGLAYESASAWEGAIILYNRAAELQEQEDYYYLFLGRALLEFSSGVPTGTATLPTDLSQIPTADLRTLVERGLRARDREDIMRASHAVLVAAQRLNPLNTDHSANLARLFRSWAFVGALGPNDVPSNALLRQLVSTKPDAVDLAKIEQSLAHYRQATSLSPQNAQLWNEIAAVQFIKGDVTEALASIDRSLNLDQQYYQTYLLRGDVLAESGDKSGALEAYRRAAALRPRDIAVLSAVGVYSAQTGDAEGALAAFKQIAEIESGALAAAEKQAADLDAAAQRAGGYERLGSSASNRRDALKNSITSHRAQLHLTYRNQALVLRDLGRTEEALAAARQALDMATDAQRPTIEALIADLERSSGQ